MKSALVIHKREEIIDGVQYNYQRVSSFIQPLNEETIHFKPSPKTWSIAENLQHLILSSNSVTTSLAIPSMVLWFRTFFG